MLLEDGIVHGFGSSAIASALATSIPAGAHARSANRGRRGRAAAVAPGRGGKTVHTHDGVGMRAAGEGRRGEIAAAGRERAVVRLVLGAWPLASAYRDRGQGRIAATDAHDRRTRCSVVDETEPGGWVVGRMKTCVWW